MLVPFAYTETICDTLGYAQIALFLDGKGQNNRDIFLSSISIGFVSTFQKSAISGSTFFCFEIDYRTTRQSEYSFEVS